MIGYIYKTTNLINGKIYIGQKRSKIFLKEKYLGSGKILKNAINKYGKHNFITECIEECETQEELNKKEVYWIKYFNSKDINIGYNIDSGGQGGHNNFNHNLKWFNNGEKEVLISTDMTIPEGYVKGRLKCREKFDHTSGNIWINNGKIQTTIRYEDLYKYPGFNIGMLDRGIEWKSHVGRYERTEETINKLKNSKKEYFLQHPEKRKNKGAFIKGCKTHNKGKISITNGVSNKYIDKELLDTWIKKGWYRGSTQKHKVRG